MSSPHLSVHLVGSVPLADAQDVFTTVSAAIGPYLQRIPDGETGARKRWVGMLSEILDRHPSFEVDPDEPPFLMKLASGKVHRELKRLRFRPGTDPHSVRFETGYAAMAIESFALFSRLQDQGLVPGGVRFQIAIPSPLAPTFNYITPRQRAAFLAVFTDHLVGEVRKIAAALPHERIAIQWDVLQEVLVWEGYFADRPADYQAVIGATLGRIGDAVPEPIELGYHLCYGSPKDEHLVQPRDAAILVELMRVIVQHVHRSIQFFHIPVPKHRSDAAFYAPLRALALPAGTQLYLGLVHVDDHEGNRERLALARAATTVAGVASECGWGRGDPTRVGALLETLRRVAAAP
jgi:hypothetical protein